MSSTLTVSFHGRTMPHLHHSRGPTTRTTETLEAIDSSLLVDTKVLQEIEAEHQSFFDLQTAWYKFTLWPTYKAYLLEDFIKLSKRARCQRTQQIDEVLSQISCMEKLNKSSPFQKQATKLLELRQKLRTLQLHNSENNFKFSKANFYALGNMAGALLAKQVKAQHKKSWILSLPHPTMKQLLTNPQEIAKAFSDFYASLYSLKKYPLTLQPTEEQIHSFLAPANLPSISDAQFDCISKLFTMASVLLKHFLYISLQKRIDSPTLSTKTLPSS